MKYLFYLFISILLLSCHSKKITKIHKLENVTKGVSTQDSICDTVFFARDVQYYDVVTKKRLKHKKESTEAVFNQEAQKKGKTMIKSELVDVSSNEVQKSVGLIAYSFPEQMSVGKPYTIKLRISKDNDRVTLVHGDRNIPINDTTIDSKITIESIRVESIMSAQLLSEEGRFNIIPVSTEYQNIDSIGYTEWEWRITPIKGGYSFLKLIVKVKTNDFFKDITVFDKNVPIKSNVIFSVKTWFNKYWQWLMTTIIIPFVIWWWNQRKKKNNAI